MQDKSTTNSLRMGMGVSGHLDATLAADYAAERVQEALERPEADLAIVLISKHHSDVAGTIAHTVRKKLSPKLLIGCTCESVVGGEIEMESVPGVSILAGRFPNVKLHGFAMDDLPIAHEQLSDGAAAMAQAAGMTREHRGTLLFGDPFSAPMNAILPTMAKARDLYAPHAERAYEDTKPTPILGGMASGSSRPGGNVFILNDRLLTTGGVGLTLSGGNLRVDALVSQGCQSIGPLLEVTEVRGQMLTGLNGQPALEVLEGILDSLNMTMRQKLRRGLFIGRAVKENVKRLGRDDFIIRTVAGVEKEHKFIVVADFLKVGETIQFQIRDAQTADQDLGLLLDLQKLYETPLGVLLLTCNGRGTRLFDKPHHDAGAFARAFAAVPGEIAAKAGMAMPPSSVRRAVPLAGMFCAGEIGPIADQVHVHGQSVCAAMFREN